MIRIFTRQIERLHSEEGQALVFVALMGLVIFLFFAMTMNVAELVNTKIKNQNVADAAAISAAVWQARTLNLVSAVNRNMLELYGAAMLAWQGCLAGALGCDQLLCGQLWVDPLFCIVCLVVTGGVGEAAIAATGGAVTTALFQDLILSGINREVLGGDLPQVVQENYRFKPNTQFDFVDVYMYPPDTGDQLVKAYIPGQPESDDFVLERVGFCPSLVMLARYGNYWWHQSEGDFGLPDADWAAFVPTIDTWFSEGGICNQELSILPGGEIGFPLGLRSRMADWSLQNVDSVLALTVAIGKAQEPPPVLGKGSGPGDCTWDENDTRFACPNHRHYAFASAHAYSESISDFYNTQMVGLAAAHEIPYIPFEMDWEARLFPIEPAGYYDIRDQIQADDFFEDSNMLTRNVLQLNGMDFFLY